jgi:uncharacterized membrane protein YedE/YeeE
MARDYRRLKAMAAGLALAILITQLTIWNGALSLQTIRYLPLQLPWMSIAIGGVMFGFGMALVGTCAFGSLVRLGSGDLRGLVVILIYGMSALAILRGWLAPFRLGYLDGINFAFPGGVQADLAALASWATGSDLRLLLAILLPAALLSWALIPAGLLRTPRLLLSGVTLGLGVAAAWFATGVLADDMSLIAAPEGLTFVAPVADSVQALAWANKGLWDFGVASVLGVILGSFLASWRHDEFHWDAYDGQSEMKRHIIGAVMMGLGGVLAGGCTVGQGITAGSVLALSWPLAVGGMALGARAGLYYLLEAPRLRELLLMR